MKLDNLKGKTIVSVAASHLCSHILTDNGEIFTFGLFEPSKTVYYEPTKIILQSNILSISCGQYHCLLLDEKSQLHSFGTNSAGMFEFLDDFFNIS